MADIYTPKIEVPEERPAIIKALVGQRAIWMANRGRPINGREYRRQQQAYVELDHLLLGLYDRIQLEHRAEQPTEEVPIVSNEVLHRGHI